jgi:hypothetical protein
MMVVEEAVVVIEWVEEVVVIEGIEMTEAVVTEAVIEVSELEVKMIDLLI